MIKKFNQALCIGLSIPMLALMILTGCSKSNSGEIDNLSKEQRLITANFKDQLNKVGAVDLSTVKSTNNGNSKLYIISAKVKDSDTKKFMLYVDERGAKPIYARFVFETNIPRDVKASDEKNLTGYVKFISLLNPKNSLYIYFDHGEQTINGKRVKAGESATIETSDIGEPENFDGFVSEEIVDQTYNQYMIEVDSRLTDCIKSKIRAMTFGDWVVFIATEPESVAAVILICALDVFVANH